MRFMAWCKESHTIVWARIQAAVGIVITALAGMSWTPLLDTSLTFRQIMVLGTILFIQGLVTEIARRYKAPEL